MAITPPTATTTGATTFAAPITVVCLPCLAGTLASHMAQHCEQRAPPLSVARMAAQTENNSSNNHAADVARTFNIVETLVAQIKLGRLVDDCELRVTGPWHGRPR